MKYLAARCGADEKPVKCAAMKARVAVTWRGIMCKGICAIGRRARRGPLMARGEAGRPCVNIAPANPRGKMAATRG